MRLNTRGMTVLSKTGLTIPPNKDVEVKEFEREADPNRNDVDSGHLYGFMILFLDKNGSLQFEKVTTYDNGRDEFRFFGDANLSYAPTEYFFSLPPKSISISEPSTTIIQPTMGRSYVTEHQGILLRDLSIVGTTGFRPGAVNKEKNRLIYEIGENGLPVDEKTGYFNFVQLRNLFRYYQFLVSEPNYVANEIKAKDLDVVMIWVNFHEGEFWECEPMAFSAARDSSSPMTFSYSITCRLLRKFDSISFKLPDWIPFAFLIDDVLNTINKYVNEIGEYANFLTNFGVRYTSVVRTVFDRFLDTSQNISRVFGITNVNNLINEIFIGTILLLNNSAKDLMNEWEPILSVRLSEDEISEDVYESYVASSYVIKTFKDSNRLLCLQRDGLHGTNRSIPLMDYTANSESYPDYNYRNVREISESHGSYSIDRVRTGETINDIAFRTLGNQDKWMDIVQLNGLNPPYISNFSSEGVLTFGDFILIPSDGNDLRIQENAVFQTDPQELSGTVKDVNIAKAMYGTDIRTRFSGFTTGGNPRVDLDIVNGDLNLVTGSDNFIQAMELKINTERGSLKLHPWYGRMFLVGLKSILTIITMSALSFKQCILADPRVLDVEDLSVVAVGDTVTTKLTVVGQRMLSRAPVISKSRI